MKKIWILTALFFASLSGALAQSQPEPSAVMKFEHLEFNFGDIEEGSPASHDFNFKNEGDKAIIILDVIKSCQCTTPTFSKEPVKPGANGKVTAGYDTKGKSGSFHKTLTVKTNIGDLILVIKGNVVPKKQ